MLKKQRIIGWRCKILAPPAGPLIKIKYDWPWSGQLESPSVRHRPDREYLSDHHQ